MKFEHHTQTRCRRHNLKAHQRTLDSVEHTANHQAETLRRPWNLTNVLQNAVCPKALQGNGITSQLPRHKTLVSGVGWTRVVDVRRGRWTDVRIQTVFSTQASLQQTSTRVHRATLNKGGGKWTARLPDITIVGLLFLPRAET